MLSLNCLNYSKHRQNYGRAICCINTGYVVWSIIMALKYYEGPPLFEEEADFAPPLTRAEAVLARPDTLEDYVALFQEVAAEQLARDVELLDREPTGTLFVDGVSKDPFRSSYIQPLILKQLGYDIHLTEKALHPEERSIGVFVGEADSTAVRAVIELANTEWWASRGPFKPILHSQWHRNLHASHFEATTRAYKDLRAAMSQCGLSYLQIEGLLQQAFMTFTILNAVADKQAPISPNTPRNLRSDVVLFDSLLDSGITPLSYGDLYSMEADYTKYLLAQNPQISAPANQ